MLPERQWKLESVAMLAMGMLVSISIGTLAAITFRQFSGDLPEAQQRFFSFVITSISLQFVGMVLIHFFVRSHEMTWAEFLGLNDSRLRQSLLLALTVVVVTLPAILFLNELCRITITHFHGPPATQPTMQVLEMTRTPVQRLWFAFTAIVMAPLVEEIFFRGVLYRAGCQLGRPRLSLLGTSLLFAVIHGSWMTMLPLTLLAIIFAKLYDRTGTLAAPILAHSVFNGVNFLLFLYRDELTRWWENF